MIIFLASTVRFEQSVVKLKKTIKSLANTKNISYSQQLL